MSDVGFGAIGAPAVNGERSEYGEPAEVAVTTVVAMADSLSGSMTIRGSGSILGSFSGRIDCDGELTIGPAAHVEADIKASRLSIAGFVRGNVTAVSRLKIDSSGRLEGDARVGALVVHEGGVHHGVIRVHPEGVPERADDSVVVSGPNASSYAGMSSFSSPMARVRKFWGEFF
jgi:cytoskeletal protein CcmA (bactofilin family)